MTEEKKPSRDNLWRDVGVYSTLGINLAFTVGAGFYLGLRLDQRYHTAPRWVLAGFLIGLGVGLYTLFTMAARFGDRTKDP